MPTAPKYLEPLQFLCITAIPLQPFSCTFFHSVSWICANNRSPYFPRSFLLAGQSPQSVGEHSLGYMPNGPTIDYRLSTIDYRQRLGPECPQRLRPECPQRPRPECPHIPDLNARRIRDLNAHRTRGLAAQKLRLRACSDGKVPN